MAAQLTFSKINYQSWLAKAVSILSGVALAVALLSIWLLYETAYKQEALRLVELAKTQAILIESVAAFDIEHSQNAHPGGASAATFYQLEAAHRKYPGFGETGEFTLGTLKDGKIIFLLSHRHFDFLEPVPIPWASDLGEPMRRALRGESGIVVGLDYRGEVVLAAHEPLPLLKAGIVAKIDLSEIRAPFVYAGFLSLAGVFVIVLVGALIFRRISIPLLERDKAVLDLNLLSQAIEQSPNMIFITATDGTIQYINSRFTEMTGYSEEEAIGQTPRILKSGDTPINIYKGLWGNLTSGRPWRSEIKDRRKDGSIFWASMVAAPVINDEGLITHFIAIHEDITRHKIAKERTRKARVQAKIANRAKSEIMANMSHELRTPLNAIIGFSATMKDEVFGPLGSDKYVEYIEDINVSGIHLLEVINDILDVSALESGKLKLNEEDVDLVETVESVLRIIGAKASEGQIALSGPTIADIPSLFADKQRLKQIFMNLLSNAVKFTPKGGMVSCDAFVDSNGSIVVTVTDTGIGMDEAGMAKAFEQFGQVDGSLTRTHEGSGLGLPLTMGLVEAHGGTMSVESEPEKGTRVTVTFPSERVV